MAPERPTQQRWRAPLRAALDWLAGELHPRFEREGTELFTDPWAARDAYGAVVSSDEAAIARLVAAQMRRPDDAARRARARELLDLERNALRMFTSCGWFFDDIAGLESVQILRYAARAIELAGADAPRLEAGVLDRLARAESNEPGAGTGRDVYLSRVKRRVPVDAASRSDWDTGGTGGDAARELLRAVTRLEHDHSSRAIAVVTELADRVQRDGSPVPFDAQTVFYRTRPASPPDRAARLAVDGRLELLLSGFYEPVLAALPRQDRIEQIDWMRQAIRRRFGVEASGLWLTERVWEPELAADLAQAGVRYALVDDRHFLVSGFSGDRLHAPFWTESDGKRVALFPIDERLRYLIPFKPPADIVAYLRSLREGGAPLAVFVDDGEKFGGWPGTKGWVYDRGWLAQFLDAMGGLIAGGEIRLTTLAAALGEVPSGGLAYLPTASYREMEGWALPPEAATRLARLERDLGEARLAGPDGALGRGGIGRAHV